VQLVVVQNHLHDRRQQAQRGLDLAQTFLDALGDGDFALAGQQLHRAHLAHVHAYRVGGAAAFGVQRSQRGGRFLGGGLIDLAVARGLAGQQQGFGIRGHFMDGNAHAVDHADDVFDLLRVTMSSGK